MHFRLPLYAVSGVGTFLRPPQPSCSSWLARPGCAAIRLPGQFLDKKLPGMPLPSNPGGLSTSTAATEMSSWCTALQSCLQAPQQLKCRRGAPPCNKLHSRVIWEALDKDDAKGHACNSFTLLHHCQFSTAWHAQKQSHPSDARESVAFGNLLQLFNPQARQQRGTAQDQCHCPHTEQIHKIKSHALPDLLAASLACMTPALGILPVTNARCHIRKAFPVRGQVAESKEES